MSIKGRRHNPACGRVHSYQYSCCGPSGSHRAAELQLGGYLESLSSITDYPAVRGNLYDELIHSRINSTWYLAASLRGEVDLRTRLFYGNSVEKIPGFSEQIKTNYEYENLDLVMWDEKRSIGYSQIDRLWLDYTRGNLETTIGRQRVAWGTAMVWNVVDLFNPKSVLDFDYEEKPGADVIRVQYYSGAVSKAELVAEPTKPSKRATVTGMFETNYAEYDLYAVAGVRDNRWLIGGAWAGALLGGGFRGEFLYGQSPDKAEYTPLSSPLPSHNSMLESDESTLSFVLSGDYTFSNSLYIHSECLFNSLGKTAEAGLYQEEALTVGLLSPAKWSLYQEFAYDLTPLTRASIFGIWNPNDNSAIMVPSVSRSLAADVDLLLIGLFASGSNGSEFGETGSSAFLRLKFSY